MDPGFRFSYAFAHPIRVRYVQRQLLYGGGRARPYHENKRAEAFRDAELEGWVLHLDAWEVGCLEVVDRIVEWARGLMGDEAAS